MSGTATQDRAYDYALRDELKRILDGGEEAPIRGHLNVDMVRSIIDGSASDWSTPAARGRFEMIAWLNAWLKQHGLDLEEV